MVLNILETAHSWRQEGRDVALATVSQTWGSAPFPVGSQLAVDQDGNFVGSVSGGCIEGAVITEALQTLKDGKLRRLEFGVSDEQAWDVGLACGGTIHVFVRPASEFLTDILSAEKQRHPVALVTDLTSGQQALVDQTTAKGDLPLPANAEAAIHQALKDERSQTLEGDALFANVFVPAPRLAIVGAVHIAQALIPMAQTAGYDVVVIDPRSAFASEHRFPGVTRMTDWPDEALASYGLDRQTALVTLTHDPKIDDPALDTALKSNCFYIGALGSTRTMAKRVDRLTAAGFTKEDIARINGPIGLNIGAKTPAEIAVAILAQIIAHRRGGQTRQ